MAGCLIRGRRRWSVAYTSPRGLRISDFFRIWNWRAFQERKPYQFPGWMKNSPYYCPGQGENPRPPAHPDFITSKKSHTLLVRPYGGGFSIYLITGTVMGEGNRHLESVYILYFLQIFSHQGCRMASTAIISKYIKLLFLKTINYVKWSLTVS